MTCQGKVIETVANILETDKVLKKNIKDNYIRYILLFRTLLNIYCNVTN